MPKSRDQHKIGRVCAICGKRRNTKGGTQGFAPALILLGLPWRQNDKAHPDCVQKALVAAKKDKN